MLSKATLAAIVNKVNHRGQEIKGSGVEKKYIFNTVSYDFIGYCDVVNENSNRKLNENWLILIKLHAC